MGEILGTLLLDDCPPFGVVGGLGGPPRAIVTSKKVRVGRFAPEVNNGFAGASERSRKRIIFFLWRTKILQNELFRGQVGRQTKKIVRFGGKLDAKGKKQSVLEDFRPPKQKNVSFWSVGGRQREKINYLGGKSSAERKK